MFVPSLSWQIVSMQWCFKNDVFWSYLLASVSRLANTRSLVLCEWIPPDFKLWAEIRNEIANRSEMKLE